MITGRNTIAIGGVGCLLKFENHFFQETFDLYLSEYRKGGFCAGESPRITITVKQGCIPQPSSPNGQCFYHALTYDSVFATMLLDPVTFSGEIGFSIIQSDFMTVVRITELIESFVCTAYIFYFSLNRAGIFMHACGIAHGNRGYIFAGPSGYGKSTIAKLSRPRTILGDEMVLLKKEGFGEKKVYGTPYTGESGAENRGVRCTAIYFIEQSAEHVLHPLKRMSGAIALLKEGIMGNFLSMKSVHNILSYDAYLSVVLEMLEGIPCYQLRFRKDNSFWRLINGNEYHAS